MVTAREKGGERSPLKRDFLKPEGLRKTRCVASGFSRRLWAEFDFRLKVEAHPTDEGCDSVQDREVRKNSKMV
jgi:hypothetical protein